MPPRRMPAVSQGLVSPRALEPSPQLPWDKRGIAPHESRNWGGQGGSCPGPSAHKPHLSLKAGLGSGDL